MTFKDNNPFLKPPTRPAQILHVNRHPLNVRSNAVNNENQSVRIKNTSNAVNTSHIDNNDDITDYDNDGIDDTFEENSQSAPMRNIGRKANLNHMSNRNISDDDIMDIFADNDEDDTGTDYDGDGDDNDLTGEDDGE